MNIGPKGDGTFDDRDLRILHGIGRWMDKNGESIYGTTAGSLPLQSWGVSTTKANRLYLHVFDWPVNGKLYVGGLKSDPSTLRLLAAPERKISFQRINDQDIVIDLPIKTNDTADAVIVMDFKQRPMTDSIRFVSNNASVTRLLAYDATQHGNGFGFGDGKTARYYVDGWKRKDQYLSWTFRTGLPATYAIEIMYLAGEGAGGTFQWQLDSVSGNFSVEQGRKGTGVLNAAIRTVSLLPGVHELTIRPFDIPGQEGMKLLECRLMPISASSGLPNSPVILSQVFSSAASQTKLLLKEIAAARSKASDTSAAVPFSPRTIENGRLKLVPSRDWTSGFFPGELWMLYEYTHQEEWKRQAMIFTAAMEQEKTNGTTHDMGFKIYCSFGNGYRLLTGAGSGPQATQAGDPIVDHYKDVILQSARTLSTRFNPKVGCIRSWDHHKNLWSFPVIIDNMMNLELLFAATRLSGDSSFYKIAVSHANTTMKNHYRPDHSSYHVVDYDPVTGRVIKKQTWQGYADSSSWARGQAWGLYAFTMCYRETRDKAYLHQAEQIAAFILHHPHLPADKIPYYDFDAPGIPQTKAQPGSAQLDTVPRDASAAAVIASGLYELSRYSTHAQEYRNTADTILKNLTDHYRARPGEDKGFILLHSTGSRPSNSEVDVPLNYADYYYLEALLRSEKP